MLWINIEKQRKRQPFFKCCLAKEMRAIFEIMFGGRICGCYILTISIEKQRKCSPFCFLMIFGVRMGELREARIPMRPAIGVLLRPTGYIFIVLAWLYMAFAEATTDTICVLFFKSFVETSMVCARNRYFDTIRRQAPEAQSSRRQGEHEKA